MALENSIRTTRLCRKYWELLAYSFEYLLLRMRLENMLPNQSLPGPGPFDFYSADITHLAAAVRLLSHRT
jgi:hypothetical protein